MISTGKKSGLARGLPATAVPEPKPVAPPPRTAPVPGLASGIQLGPRTHAVQARRSPAEATHSQLAARTTTITPTRALALTLGLEGGFDGRVPLHHLSWLRRIQAARPELEALTDAELRTRFDALGARVRAGTPVRDLAPEALAVVRETSARALGKEPYEVQVLAALALIDGKLAQLRTGEGKTLSAAIASSVLALGKKGTHVATSNGYLAERDAEAMKPLFSALGLTVGVAKSWGQTYDEKREAYRADVTYAHADTLAFDWLEDQTWWQRDWRVQRPLNAVIVDEADEVLLDNATCPLVLCGAAEPMDQLDARQDRLRLADRLARALDQPGLVKLENERGRVRPYITDEGITEVERLVRDALGLKDGGHVWTEEQGPLLMSILQALEARHSVILGKDYIQAADQLTLVASGTGRPSPGSRLRHGLMDSVLAKEDRQVEPELTPMGAISYPAFFSRYTRMAGMTGTSQGRREELAELYGLQTVAIPTHRPSQRVDEPDAFFPHAAPRLLAAVADILEAHERGQPVLVSTVSVTASKQVSARLREPLVAITDVALSSAPLFEAALSRVQGGAGLRARVSRPSTEGERQALGAELLSLFRSDESGRTAFADVLERAGLPARRLLAVPGGIEHRVLNAETHAEEASIIGVAGEKGAVTVATQMAGRGTDIPLTPEVIELGGLRVVGIERKGNARQDDQVRGRAGRQGQPGSSRFYVSLSDDVFTYLPAANLRALASKVATSKLDSLPRAISRAYEAGLAKAQDRGEQDNAGLRRNTMRLSGALETARKQLLGWREEVLDSTTVAASLSDWLVEDRLAKVSPKFEAQAVRDVIAELDPYAPELAAPPTTPEAFDQALRVVVTRRIEATRAARSESPEAFNQFLRGVVLSRLDGAWLGHVLSEEELQRAAYLHAYGQRDPFVEHQIESAKAFTATMGATRGEIREAFVSVVRAMLPLEPMPGA